MTRERPPDRLPGDTYRDAAALLEAIDRRDEMARIAIMREASHRALALLLAGECLKLARQAHGDITPWIAGIRQAGEAIDTGWQWPGD
jgi:hypothetical protein